MVKITAAIRPYVIFFRPSGKSFPLTAEAAQRLLDEYPAHSIARNRVVLKGFNSGTPDSEIFPATLGGGNAFSWEK